MQSSSDFYLKDFCALRRYFEAKRKLQKLCSKTTPWSNPLWPWVWAGCLPRTLSSLLQLPGSFNSKSRVGLIYHCIFYPQDKMEGTFFFYFFFSKWLHSGEACCSVTCYTIRIYDFKLLHFRSKPSFACVMPVTSIKLEAKILKSSFDSYIANSWFNFPLNFKTYSIWAKTFKHYFFCPFYKRHWYWIGKCYRSQWCLTALEAIFKINRSDLRFQHFIFQFF